MKVNEARQITGGLSDPSKMPGKAYSLPPSECITGSILRCTPNSICSQCYACKGRYNFSNVQNSLQKRLSSIYHPLWIEAMSFLINREKCKYFRWHDSGDLQSYQHLLNIVEVCVNCPDYHFRLPTKEYSFIFKYLKEHKDFPENLTVRLSSFMIDKDVQVDLSSLPITRSVVVQDVDNIPEDGIVCPATTVRHKCDKCTMCWSRDKKCIVYKAH